VFGILDISIQVTYIVWALSIQVTYIVWALSILVPPVHTYV